MAQSVQDSEDMITAINITPMVDVMLVLLVIFMMAAPTLYRKSIQVDLPAAKSGTTLEKVTLKFTLLKDGKILSDKKEVTLPEVSAQLADAVKKDPQTDAVVEADRSLTHGVVVEFIDRLRSAGIQRFAIAVTN